jgi:SAM-dependent methyltransferase
LLLTLRQFIVSSLRRLGLLEAVDRIQYYRVRTTSKASASASLPPSDLAYDAYGTVDGHTYLSTGLETARLIDEILSRSFPDQRPRRLLEWGCGPGRIVRHLRPLNWIVCGSDYNPATVRWCRDNIEGVEFSENGLEPPLPYEAESFDAIYCISVFTHLAKTTQRAWVKELARVMRPGGLLIASFHGDASRSFLLPAERRRYDGGEVVIRGNVREGNRTFVSYHPPLSVCALLSPEFEIVTRRTSPISSLGVHDLYVARRTVQGHSIA